MNVCIQIGNTDNKLSQQNWSKYCHDIKSICDKFGIIHFTGGAPTDMPWQNYCVCVMTDEPEILRESVIECRKKYLQDSVAWLEGFNSFI